MDRHNEIRRAEFEDHDASERIRLGMMAAYLAEASGAEKKDGTRIQVWDIYPSLRPQHTAEPANESEVILAKFIAMSKKVH